jgi:myosin heavy subunit
MLLLLPLLLLLSHTMPGYPFRRTFDEFMRSYWQLYPSGRFAAQQSAEAGADACRALLAGCGLAEGADYQIGAHRSPSWGAQERQC